MHLRSLSCSLLATVLLVGSSSSALDQAVTLRTEPNRPAISAAESTKALIAQLGSADFAKRREAEARLIELGAAAFDDLHHAQADSDLEIASQSQYLLHRVPIDWARPYDSAAVRELMANYAKVNSVERHEMIAELDALEEAAGLAALSRIAHFELSMALAKHAALAVLNDRNKHEQDHSLRSRLILEEIGTSPRDSAQWLRLYASQLGDRQKIDPQWLTLIDEETERMKEDRDRTSLSLLLRLMEFHVQLSKDYAQPEPLFETLRRRIDLLAEETEHERDAIVQAINWCIKNEQWPALGMLETHYSQSIKADRLLLYLVAAGRAAHHLPVEAAELAKRAYNHVAFDVEERNRVGDVVADLGHHDWAEREWRFVIDKTPLTSTQSMIARTSVANWCLHDRGEDKAAAELLGEVCDAVDGDPEMKNTVMADSEASYYLNNMLRTQREYFTACHLESQEDFNGQRKALEKAFSRNYKDPDVLIAMHRLQEADDTYRERVKGRIVRALAEVEQEIENEPNEPNGYNHYAWLVSNTEGDFDKAIRYSLKSLELSPDTPSYLDTLGRCYFAAGDLENAIKSQRQAVKMHPQVQVMQKQLEMFEKAQAEKQ